MLLKVSLRTPRPPQRHLHRLPHPLPLRRILRALVERHNNVRAQPDLYLHRPLRTKKVRRPIQVRPERHSLLRHLPQIAKTENLKPARVGKDRPLPRHEAVQPAHPPHHLHPRPQIKMISVPQQNPDPQLLQQILRHTLNRPQSPHRHKHRRLHHPCGVTSRPARPAPSRPDSVAAST